MSVEDEVSCMVNEYSSSNKLLGFVFLAQHMSQLTKGGRHVLVTGDAITRSGVASSEEAFPEGSVWMLQIDESDPFLFSILACFTFRRFTAGRAMVSWNGDTLMKVSFSTRALR